MQLKDSRRKARRERAYMGGFYHSNVFPFFILSDTTTDDISQRAEISNVFLGKPVSRLHTQSRACHLTGLLVWEVLWKCFLCRSLPVCV